MSVEWMDANWSWVWLLWLRRVGGVLLSLALEETDAIQRRANSIAGHRDDSNSSLVRREFGRRCGTCQVHSTTVHTADTHTHRLGHHRELLNLHFNMTPLVAWNVVFSTSGSYVTISHCNFTVIFLLSWSYSSIPHKVWQTLIKNNNGDSNITMNM